MQLKAPPTVRIGFSAHNVHLLLVAQERVLLERGHFFLDKNNNRKCTIHIVRTTVTTFSTRGLV